MGFFDGLWRLASLLNWGTPETTGGTVTHWYDGPLAGLVNLLMKPWSDDKEDKNKPAEDVRSYVTVPANVSSDPRDDGFVEAQEDPRVSSVGVNQQGKSVIVMFTKNENQKLAVKAAYLVYYGARGIVQGTIKLVSTGAYLGCCLVKAGVNHFFGDGEKHTGHSDLLEQSGFIPPPAVIAGMKSDDQVTMTKVENNPVTVLYSGVEPSIAMGAPGMMPPGTGVVPNDTQFVCYNLDDRTGDAQVAEFERNLQSQLPPHASVVEMPAVEVQNYITRNSQLFGYPPIPSAPPQTGSFDPNRSVSLQQFVDEFRQNPVPLGR